MADYGFALVFYLLFACLFFFIPSALVSAELAATYPQKGGVYLWVKKAYGPEYGFVAIFMQWVMNIPWYPAAFTFVASAIAYMFRPDLATNKWFVVAVIWVGIWAGTFFNFRGMKMSAFLSTSGVIAGTLVPGIIIIALGVIYVIMGHPSAISFSASAFFPSLGNFSQLMLLAGMLLAFSGMEMSAVHVTEVNNPKKEFPKAIFIAAAIIIVLAILTALSIAIVVPRKEISFAAGVMQAFDAFFHLYKIEWAMPILAALLAYGVFTMAVTWMIGPSKGLLEVAREGYLPRRWQKRNKQQMPTGILWVQGVFASVVSLAVFIGDSVSSAFWLLSALAVQLYLVMYLLMFSAAIRLRHKDPDVVRPYSVPGGKAGLWIISGIGFVASALVILFGFIPPETVRAKGTGSVVEYVAFLIGVMIVFIAIPFIFFHMSKKRPHWRTGEPKAPKLADKSK
jgi:glutamate:GABA antiporter